MKYFFIIVALLIFVVASAITLSNFIEQDNSRYRETTPQERAEFDSAQKKFVEEHRAIEVRVKIDSLNKAAFKVRMDAEDSARRILNNALK